MANIRVLLADDHPIVRSGIKSALEVESDIDVVGEASDGNEAQSFTAELKPDILLLDLNMPGPSATDTITYIRQNFPQTKVIMLTAHDEDAYIRAVMRAGVSGYLLKDEAVDTVVKAVRAVRKGAAWYSQEIAERFVQWQFGTEPEIDDANLTPRERELLSLIAKGWDNGRIAEALNLAEQTVRNYASTLYEKLQVHSRAEAVVWAREHGFVEESL
ncbi:MAG: response regulator transcription factor [Trueperaceae bacterium]|nr:response regulator transcription factor [Trueperaceae bacterium]